MGGLRAGDNVLEEPGAVVRAVRYPGFTPMCAVIHEEQERIAKLRPTGRRMEFRVVKLIDHLCNVGRAISAVELPGWVFIDKKVNGLVHGGHPWFNLAAAGVGEVCHI